MKKKAATIEEIHKVNEDEIAVKGENGLERLQRLGRINKKA